MKYWVVYSYNEFFYIRHVHQRNKILIFTKKINFFHSFIADYIFLMLITVQAQEKWMNRVSWQQNKRDEKNKQTNRTNKRNEQKTPPFINVKWELQGMSSKEWFLLFKLNNVLSTSALLFLLKFRQYSHFCSNVIFV